MKYLKTIFISFSSIIISTIILSLLYYYNLLSNSVYHFLLVIIISLLLIINGFKVKRLSNSKKHYNLLLSSGIALILLLINTINSNINLKTVVYIFILSISNLLGGFLYKTKKKWIDHFSFFDIFLNIYIIIIKNNIIPDIMAIFVLSSFLTSITLSSVLISTSDFIL